MKKCMLVVCATLSVLGVAVLAQAAEEKSTPAIATVDGMPAVLDSRNLYSEAAAGHFSPAIAGA